MTLIRSRVDGCQPYANQRLVAEVHANLGCPREGEGGARSAQDLVIARDRVIGKTPKPNLTADERGKTRIRNRNPVIAQGDPWD
ncbi:MAG TPA: hypothetical protein VKZ53_04825 [Candidatus Angelobacter sp.]|nr:hypothetical protein [Candidatus Angelobacter sp.]